MDFDIFDKLGKGNSLFMGEYKGETCVVKIGEKVYDEINALKNLQHENIIKLLGHYENNEKLYTMLEYFPGTNLYDWKQEHMKSNVDVIISQLQNVVKYMHSQNFVHGNLTSNGILIFDNHVKLIDFTKPNPSSIYLSPEIFKNESDVTVKSDLWALGILMFILLTSVFPFEGNSEKTVRERILTVKPKFKKYVLGIHKKQIKTFLKRKPENRCFLPPKIM